MTTNLDPIQDAIARGQERAERLLEERNRALVTRRETLSSLLIEESAMELEAAPPEVRKLLGESAPAGVLVAEGDSWFDYPLHDVLEALEDNHGFRIEHVARAGDRIEDMAYSDGQLKKFIRKLEDVIRDARPLRGVLLSGGGNDIAGDELAMLLEHRDSSLPHWNQDVLRGVIDQRVQMSYVHILASVTRVCEGRLGRRVPIILHGYGYPVPDGRGVLGGFGPLPGPWLEPSFRRKGFGGGENEALRRQLMMELMDRFNAMLQRLVALPEFHHVRYVDLRSSLSNGVNYRDFWANELHPTRDGFDIVAGLMAAAV